MKILWACWSASGSDLSPHLHLADRMQRGVAHRLFITLCVWLKSLERTQGHQYTHHAAQS